MASKLKEAAAATPFPLFGVRRSAWDGSAFVGSVTRSGGVVDFLSFVYLDDIDASTMGASVGNLDARVEVRDGVDPVPRHLTDFVARFEPSYIVRRMRRRKFRPFPPDDFSERALTIGVAGETVGATLLTHRTLPLQLLRVVKRRGDHMTDVGVATWRLSVTDFAAKIDPVDPRFIDEFDAAVDAPYPPPEWM